MSKELKVGLFVIVGLALMMLAVFLIGEHARLWEPRVDYITAFQDVAGLKPGAPVRMGGLDIGAVTSVGHGTTSARRAIFVKMSIVKSEGGAHPHRHHRHASPTRASSATR